MKFEVSEVSPDWDETAILGAAALKEHLRIDDALTSDDDYLEDLGRAAIRTAEAQTGLILVERSFEMNLSSWPNGGETLWWDGVRQGPITAITRGGPRYVELPRGPMGPEITPSLTVKTYSRDDTETDVDTSIFYLDKTPVLPRMYLRDNQLWPTAMRSFNPIKITWNAGYSSDSAGLPPAVLLATKQMVAHWYENRLPVTILEGGVIPQHVPMSAFDLLRRFKVRRI